MDRAIASRIQRAARLRDRAQENILEKVALIDTAGSHVGQINGLSVIESGGFAFGRPTAQGAPKPLAGASSWMRMERILGS